jgi:AcrR family transcriptional regulator
VTKRRLRRSPELGRGEILEAAEAAIAELDWSELTVELLMERTGMTRSSFYHYFASLEELAMALFGRIEDEIGDAVDDWLGGEPTGDPLAVTTEHLGRLFAIWGKHAGLLHAIQQAGARDRRVYEEWRSRVVDAYVARTAAFIRREVARGLSDAPDPERLAHALIWMNTGVTLDLTSRPRAEPPERAVRALARVWNASIYGRY